MLAKYFLCFNINKFRTKSNASQGFWGTGEMAFNSGEQGNKDQILTGTGEQRPNFDGNKEHKKYFFSILGNRGTSQFIVWEQGNRCTLGGPYLSPLPHTTA